MRSGCGTVWKSISGLSREGPCVGSRDDIGHVAHRGGLFDHLIGPARLQCRSMNREAAAFWSPYRVGQIRRIVNEARSIQARALRSCRSSHVLSPDVRREPPGVLAPLGEFDATGLIAPSDCERARRSYGGARKPVRLASREAEGLLGSAGSGRALTWRDTARASARPTAAPAACPVSLPHLRALS